MTKQEKNEVIEVLKGKFSQYNNFYITDTESLTVAQISKLRSVCFDKQVEMKVAKNTLIRKALESIDAEKYAAVYDSLHKVTALMFSENPKDPAVIISGFRKEGEASIESCIHQWRRVCWRQSIESVDADQDEERVDRRHHWIVAITNSACIGSFGKQRKCS
jgi:ribosomal protein L10